MCLTPFSFGINSRICDKAGFSNVFAKRRITRRYEHFSVFAVDNGQTNARLGVVVAKKNVRLAVDRNKVKRIIRESFRKQKSSLSGFDIVVVVKKGFSKAPGEFFAIGGQPKHAPTNIAQHN